MIKIIREARNYDLYAKYAKFNQIYFDNKLPQNMEIVYRDFGGRSSFGARATEDLIEVNAHYFEKLSERQKDSVIVHEMVHIWTHVTGTYNSKNIHKGEFLKKAKEIERQNPELDIVGTVLKQRKDDFDSESPSVYMVFFTHDKNADKLMSKNVDGYKFYSVDTPIKDIEKDNTIDSFYNQGFIYRVETNSPIIGYDQIKGILGKNINPTNKALKHFFSLVKRNPEYAEFVSSFYIDSKLDVFGSNRTFTIG